MEGKYTFEQALYKRGYSNGQCVKMGSILLLAKLNKIIKTH